MTTEFNTGVFAGIIIGGILVCIIMELMGICPCNQEFPRSGCYEAKTPCTCPEINSSIILPKCNVSERVVINNTTFYYVDAEKVKP